MFSPDGESFIDCDIHQQTKGPKDLFPYLPAAYRERIELFGTGLAGRSGYPNGGDKGWRADSWGDDGSNPCSDVEALQEKHLNIYNVEYGILLGQEYRPIPTLPDVDYAAALAAAYNDWMIENWLERDDRLKGVAIIPAQDPQLAAQEIRRVGSHPDIIGVLVPNGTRVPYGQRFYNPIFDVCVELDLPFVIHTGGESASPVGRASYYVESRQLRAPAMQMNLASMVFEGLFERYPTLRVCCIEAGFTWLAPFLWRMDADWKALNRETPWVKKSPSEYIFEHCKFASQPMESPEPQRRLLQLFDWIKAEDILMFASDYPHFDFDAPELALPPLSDEVRRKIFSENAREVFKLPVRQRELISAD